MARGLAWVGVFLAGCLVATACGGGDAGGGGGAGNASGAGGLDGGGATGGSSAGAGGGGAAVGGTGATAGSGGGGAECTSDADCVAKMPATNPAGCAEAKCDLVLKQCNFLAKDADGDGHTAAKCAAIGSGAIETGDDCDDGDPQTYPGAWDGPADGSKPDRCDSKDQDCDGNADDEKTSTGKSCACDPSNPPKCNEDTLGNPIGGLDSSKDGVGICKLGVRECVGGVAGKCAGASGPNEKNCSSSADNDCNGKIDSQEASVCQCQSGAVQDCTTSLQGECAAGSQGCEFKGSSSSWQACLPKAPALSDPDCSTAKDRNCNGAADNGENGCKCKVIDTSNNTTYYNQGSTVACNAHPGYDDTGVCKAGSQQCVLAGTSIGWSPCSGDVGPAAQDQCDATTDYNCDGKLGNGPNCFVTVYTLIPPNTWIPPCGFTYVPDAMWSTNQYEGGWVVAASMNMWKTGGAGKEAAVRCFNGSKHASYFGFCPSGWSQESVVGYVAKSGGTGRIPVKAFPLPYGGGAWVNFDDEGYCGPICNEASCLTNPYYVPAAGY